MSENTNDLNEVFEETMFDAEVITVPIDDTLTHSGEAADAAAVGAALDLKMDKTGMVTISVNGETPDAQGVILVTAEDTKMSSTDQRTIQEAVAAVDEKTGADIPVSSETGAQSISEAISGISSRTANDIPMDPSDGSLMISGKIAEMDQAMADMETAITEAEERTGAMIPMSGTDPTKLKDAIEARVKTVNGTPPDRDGDVYIDSVPFADNLRTNQAQNVVGTFNIRTSGGGASIEDGEAWLTSVRGNRIHTGYVAESIDMSVNRVEREPGEDTINATIDRDTFVEFVPSSGTITLTYTTSWSASPTSYGITVTGTPKYGDEIVVVYVKEERGIITQSTPETFVATGWNLYNNDLGYARAVRYSEEYGYCVAGTYTSLQFSTTLAGEKTEITPVGGYFNVPSNGYIWVNGGTAADTEIYITWSDWVDPGDHPSFQAYTETVIDLTDTMEEFFPYGLMRTGDIRDELNLNAGLAISNVERIAYNAENLAEAEESGRVYEYDEDWIYLERAAAVVNAFSVSGEYTVSDHGIEYFTGSTVPAYAAVLYGNNLKNKLERDVLTISSQTLTDAEQAQARANINVYTFYERTRANLDLLTVAGTYYYPANSTGAPTTGAGRVYVMKSSLSGYGIQIANPNANAPTLYARSITNSGFSAWYRISTSST